MNTTERVRRQQDEKKLHWDQARAMRGPRLLDFWPHGPTKLHYQNGRPPIKSFHSLQEAGPKIEDDDDGSA